MIESTDSVPGSSVDTMGEPQGDQHITTSSSLVVEESDDVPASTTMSASTAMVVEETPSAMHGTNRTNPPPKATIRERLIAGAHTQREHKVLMDAAREEIDSLRKELAKLQSLEEDSDAHPSNRQARADRVALTKTRKELSELHATHWIAEKELERAKDINDKTIVENLALHRSITDWRRSCGSLQAQLDVKTKELATLSAATEAQDKKLENFREGQYYDEFSDSTRSSHLSFWSRTIPYVLTSKRSVSRGSSCKRTSTLRRGIATSSSERSKGCVQPFATTPP